MKKNWTALEILQATIPYLQKRLVENPRLNAERLLAYTLNINRIDIYLQFERILTDTEIREFRAFVKRRGEGEPLQYILGETEFMGLPFFVTPSVLIPRPESEVLVEETLALREHIPDKSVEIWDIGTGSGCIAISIAYHWPECNVLATDISDDAIKIAEKNAERNNVSGRIQFLRHDILKTQSVELLNAKIVISNPPYIKQDELDKLYTEIKDFEPAIALTDFSDGLSFYKSLFELNFKEMGVEYLIVELSGTQTQEILNIAQSKNLLHYQVINDLNHIPRVLRIRIE
jgi:release factor glutamine methyltransferase